MLDILVPRFRPIVNGPHLWIPEMRLQVWGGSVEYDDFDVDRFLAQNPGLIPNKPGMPYPDVQVFLPRIPSVIQGVATGISQDGGVFNGSWYKPVGARWIELIMITSGAGGGAGAKTPNNAAASGGAGGGGGAVQELRMHPDDLPTEVWLLVDPGGAGGPPRTTNTQNGLQGSAGGRTIFGSRTRLTGSTLMTQTAASGGTGGQLAAAASAGQPALGVRSGTTGGAGNNGAAGSTGTTASSWALSGATGGGSGGGLSAANAQFAGGSGGSRTAENGNVVMLAGGAAATNGQDGIHPFRQLNYMGANAGGTGQVPGGGLCSYKTPMPGYGGSGGGSSNTAALAGRGGHGGQFGAGGGGGGAGTDSVCDSGAGGSGGDGIIVVISW